MKNWLLALLIAYVGAVAAQVPAPKYKSVTDPQLLLDAVVSLKTRHPTLTAHDLLILSGMEATRLYKQSRGEPQDEAT